MPYKRGKTFAEKSAEKKKEPEKKLTPAQRLKVAQFRKKVAESSASANTPKNVEIR